MKPQQQIGQGALARAGAADHGGGLAWIQGEGDIPEHRLLRPWVREAHVVKLHRRAAGPGHSGGSGPVLHVGPGIQQGGEACQAGPGLGQRGEHRHRHEQVTHGQDGVLGDGGDLPHLHAAAQGEHAARPQHHGHEGAHEHPHHRNSHGKEPVQADHVVGVGAVGVAGAGLLIGLIAEGPDHPHAGDRLPHHTVDAVQAHLDAAGEGVGLSEHHGGHRRQRRHKAHLYDGHDRGDHGRHHDGRAYNEGSGHHHLEHHPHGLLQVGDVGGGAGDHR